MPPVTIVENGRETVVTDIDLYREKLAAALAELDAFYADFEKRPADALDTREEEIVALLNSVNRYRYVIAQFVAAETRRANILSGWEVVKRYRAGDST